MTHKQPSSEGRGIWKHYFDESGHKHRVIRVIPCLDIIIQEQRPLNADSPHHIFCELLSPMTSPPPHQPHYLTWPENTRTLKLHSQNQVTSLQMLSRYISTIIISLNFFIPMTNYFLQEIHPLLLSLLLPFFKKVASGRIKSILMKRNHKINL